MRKYISQAFGLDMHRCEERILLLNERMNILDITKLLKMPENQKMRKLAIQELLQDMNLVVKHSHIVEKFDRVGVSQIIWMDLKKV